MDKIGRYNILERIGKGGMGIVYRALDTVLQREVALKTHTVGPDPTAQSVERFFREARIIASFKHQNIVTVFDLGHDGDKVFIAMELLHGEDLTGILSGGRHVSLEEKLRIVESVAKGLAHAHGRDIVHRDIKPRNVFVTDDGEVKLLDFGLAHIAHSTLTEAGQIIGTPFYMSPEQVLGLKANPSSDIFSLGSLFYELLTGRRAFDGNNLEQIFDAIVTDEPTPVRDLNPTIPEELARIVAKTMSKRTERRYRTVDDLLRDLARFRGFLRQYKQQLRREASSALQEIDSFARHHPRIVSDHHISLPSKRLLGALDQNDLSYLSLVGLRDGANLQRRRVERLVDEFATQSGSDDATMTMYEPPIRAPGDEREQRLRNARAEDKFAAARSHFQSGDLAGSLRLVSDALRLKPDHRAADVLAERVRTSIVELADRAPGSGNRPQHIDVLVAALLAIGEPGGERHILGGHSNHSRNEISDLSDIFLAGLPEEKKEQ